MPDRCDTQQERMDRRKAAIPKEESGDFVYRAGCTILIDAATQEIRRVIRTAGTITDDDALRRVRSFRMGETGVTGNAFDAGIADGFKAQRHNARDEPFALLHQSQEVL